jgi:hypothetical protein
MRVLGHDIHDLANTFIHKIINFLIDNWYDEAME